MKKFVLVLALDLSSSACGAILSALPAVIATVTDAMLILDNIEQFVDAFFAVKPDPALQSKVQGALSVARQSLSVAVRMAKGAEDLSQKDADAAFDEFRQAYKDLLVLVQPLGVQQAGSGGALGASPAGLVVPEPLALSAQ